MLESEASKLHSGHHSQHGTIKGYGTEKRAIHQSLLRGGNDERFNRMVKTGRKHTDNEMAHLNLTHTGNVSIQESLQEVLQESRGI